MGGGGYINIFMSQYPGYLVINIYNKSINIQYREGGKGELNRIHLYYTQNYIQIGLGEENE